MEIRYTKSFLAKLEDVFAETDYILRYEKGSFKSGYCIIKESKIAIVNKFYSLEGKINCVVEMLQEIQPDESKLSPKNKTFLDGLLAKKLDR